MNTNPQPSGTEAEPSDFEQERALRLEAELRIAEMTRRAKRSGQEAWARGYMKAVASLLRPGDLAIDLGANIGAVTKVLAATGADVIAFEPDPVTFAKLTERFAGHANVSLVNAAVGVGGGTVRLMRGENFEENPRLASTKSTILAGAAGVDTGNFVDVPLIDFPTLVRQEVAKRGRIDFIKMDIEGSELDVLEAMDRENLFENIRALVAETHEHKFKELRPRYRKLRELIARTQPSGRISLDWI